MSESKEEGPATKEVSVQGIRSSNAFKQNLRRARAAASKTKRKRKHLPGRKNRPRTKIRLTMKNKSTNPSNPPQKDTNTQSKDTNQPVRKMKKRSRRVLSHKDLKAIPKTRPVQSGRGVTKKRGVLKHGKTVRKEKRVRWKDQETGSSLVAYSDSGLQGFRVNENPLMKDDEPMRLRVSQTRKRSQSRTTNHTFRKEDDEPINIRFQWSMGTEEVPQEDVIGNEVEEIPPEQARERLKGTGIELSKSAPPDLISTLVGITEDFGNGTIQKKG